MNINSTIFGQVVSFILFISFCAKFVWPPLKAAIEARQKTIADGLNATVQAKQELASAQQGIKGELDAAKAQAAHIVDQANRRAAQIVEEAKAQAITEGERLRAQSRDAIDQEIGSAREALRVQVAELSVLGAQKILVSEVNAAAHAKMLDQLASQL